MRHDDPQFRRAARVIERLVEEPDDAPLADLAANEGVSAFHLQRSFRLYSGLSPKRFAEFVSVCRAQGLLRAARSVLDVSLELGLSSTGRLHDRFVTIAATTPGEYRSGGAGMCVGHGIGATPLGPALLAWTPRGICRLGFADGDGFGRELAVLRRDWPVAELRRDDGEARRRLGEAFAPDAARLPLPLAVRGSDFQVAVWRALLEIPEGGVTSYGELADRIGSAGASRAIGRAVGDNPVAVLIPCHRVIRASGALSGYRWGVDRKAALLARELAAPHTSLRR
jgi:AraC family transcriptional regulator of adaptative response/methylated-DNA-[protein]-cysteine methyltransferase